MLCRKQQVKRVPRDLPVQGFTLLELLCVMAIITVLASLLLGPACRVLQRVRADQWSEDASTLLRSTVSQLNQHFQGERQFPLVTLERIEAKRLFGPTELRFLKDRRVTFIPFDGSDPDDKIVIRVQLRSGFLTDGGQLTESKEAITRMPD